jgi:diguanylate cyclase
MSFITNYEFTDEENSHFLRQIIQFISTHKITPTPINYALSYEYVSGSNKKLITAINLLIKDKKNIDNELTTNLYNKFIHDTSYESFDKVNQSLESLISNTRDSVAATSQKASDAGVVFEEQADSIASVKNTDDLKKVMSEIVSEAKGLADVSKSLKTELDSANQEMEQLRVELVKARESAATDALTGLLNRGTFDKMLNRLIDQDEHSEACLTMLDLDHFKQVNDTHGHLIGDNVLKFTAKLLREHADPKHYVVRYGGEELAIIMPNTSLNQASEIAENIRSSLESSRLKKKNSSESIGKITVSIGISKLKQDDTAEDLIMRADTAMYRAKETGRNKVVTEAV